MHLNREKDDNFRAWFAGTMWKTWTDLTSICKCLAFFRVRNTEKSDHSNHTRVFRSHFPVWACLYGRCAWGLGVQLKYWKWRFQSLEMHWICPFSSTHLLHRRDQHLWSCSLSPTQQEESWPAESHNQMLIKIAWKAIQFRAERLSFAN